MSDRFVSAINQALSEHPELQRLFRSPRYRYFGRAGSKDRYFWTTEKISHNGKPKYVAGIYRHLKSKNQFKLVKRAGFAKRYKAEAAAKAYRDKESEA